MIRYINDQIEELFSHMVPDDASEELVGKMREAYRKSRLVTLADLLGRDDVPQEMRDEAMEVIVRLATNNSVIW